MLTVEIHQMVKSETETCKETQTHRGKVILQGACRSISKADTMSSATVHLSKPLSKKSRSFPPGRRHGRQAPSCKESDDGAERGRKRDTPPRGWVSEEVRSRARWRSG